MDEPKVGTVKWFDKKKGHGFIQEIDRSSLEPFGTDIFVHYKDIKGDSDFKILTKNQLVRFQCHSTSKGLQAKEVRPNS
ncbi:cold shock domain-containing protein [Enterovibrio norvegicus]|uniref:cold shock domain-containing protein n=1 Tax=Enterovibrio norvegicus TaxID=188144 RepID=UPI00352DF4C8